MVLQEEIENKTGGQICNEEVQHISKRKEKL